MGFRWPSGLLLGCEISLDFSQSACLVWALPHSLTHPYLSLYSCSNCCSAQQHPIGKIKINSNILRGWRGLLSLPQSLSGYLSIRPIKYAPVSKWSPEFFLFLIALYSHPKWLLLTFPCDLQSAVFMADCLLGSWNQIFGITFQPCY